MPACSDTFSCTPTVTPVLPDSPRVSTSTRVIVARTVRTLENAHPVVGELGPPRPSEPADRGECPVVQMGVPAQQQVVEHGDVREKLDILEGPRHPRRSDPMWTLADDVRAVDDDPTADVTTRDSEQRSTPSTSNMQSTELFDDLTVRDNLRVAGAHQFGEGVGIHEGRSIQAPRVRAGSTSVGASPRRPPRPLLHRGVITASRPPSVWLYR